MSGSREPGRLLTAGEVAARWSCSVSQVYSLARSGRLPVVRLGGSVRFRPEDVAKAAKSRRESPVKPKPVRVVVPRRTPPMRAEVRRALRTDWDREDAAAAAAAVEGRVAS